ncbi:MAG: ABC transporter permease [Cyclobacteriaceae bacterium]|nr:ABC transporter permease [Cyclobacteriaceae bacterium]
MSEQHENISPPRWAEKLLSWYCKPELLEDLQGDLNEYFQRNVKAKGVKRAKLIYVIDIIKFMRLYTLKRSARNFQPGILLYKNYLLTARRNLLKNKLNAALSFSGLTLGIACFALIFLRIQHEYSFDRHYHHADRILKVSMSLRSLSNEEETRLGWSDAPLLNRLRDGFPEAEAVTGIAQLRGIQKIKNAAGDTFIEEGIFEADPAYFRVFNNRWLEGNPETALQEPASIVLTKKFAYKYFHEETALDKTLTLNNREYRVTGVIEDLPANTDLTFNALVSLDSHFGDWCFVYVLAQNTPDVKLFQQKLDTLFADELAPVLELSNMSGGYLVESLTDVHFSERKMFDPPKGSKTTLSVLAAISFIILIVSAANYINISIAQAAKRKTEIGVRKVFGALQKQLRSQYLIESAVLCLAGLALSFLLIATFSSQLVTTGLLNHVPELPVLAMLFCLIIPVVLVISILAGWYPAVKLSLINPIHNLQQQVSGYTRFTKNLLIAFQFTAVLTLVFVTKAVYDQMQVLTHHDRLADRNQVMVVDLPRDETLLNQLPQLKNSLKSLSGVVHVSLVGRNSTPTRESDFDTFTVELAGQQQIKMLAYAHIDEDYFDVLGAEVALGRTFQSSDVSGNRDVVIVNEAMVRMLNWKNPLNQKITYGSEARVVGVIKDFSFSGQHRVAEPMLFYLNNKTPEKLFIRYSSSRHDYHNLVKEVWQSALSGQPFEYRLLDDYFEKQLENETKLKNLLTLFSCVTVAITLMGLFGLLNINLAEKEKETGIRKILGAGMQHLLLLTWRDLGALALVACMFACLIGYLTVQPWLNGFAHQATVGAANILVAFGVLAGSMLIAVCYHLIKLSAVKPVKILKQE